MRTFRDQPDLIAIPVLLGLLAFFTPSDLRFATRPVLQGVLAPALSDCPQLSPLRLPPPPEPLIIPEGAELI
jgi:hypothetical protein